MLSLTLDFSLFKLYILSSKSLAYSSIKIEHSLSYFSIVKLYSMIHLINSLVCNYAEYSISVWLAWRNSATSLFKLAILPIKK